MDGLLMDGWIDGFINWWIWQIEQPVQACGAVSCISDCTSEGMGFDPHWGQRNMRLFSQDRGTIGCISDCKLDSEGLMCCLGSLLLAFFFSFWQGGVASSIPSPPLLAVKLGTVFGGFCAENMHMY
jgi:hypothetical protein